MFSKLCCDDYTNSLNDCRLKCKEINLGEFMDFSRKDVPTLSGCTDSTAFLYHFFTYNKELICLSMHLK